MSVNQYLGVEVDSVCVLAGTELQACVDWISWVSIIVLVRVISVSRRMRLVCREKDNRNSLTNISLSTCYWLSQLY